MAEKNLSENIFALLSERILRWDFLPGYRFTEEALCEEFGVSRSPVREALNMLAEKGLVEKRPKLGYSVRLLDFREINELYDVRLALEEFVVARITMKDVDLGELGGLLDEWSSLQAGLPGTAELVPAADERFHEALSTLTRNETLVRALKDIDRRIHFVRLADFSRSERVLATCVQHLEILHAIRDRDTPRALEALRLNIEGGRSSVERAIKEALAHAYRNRD